MKKNTFANIKNVLMTIFFILIVITFFLLFISTIDNKLIKNIKTFIKSDTKILYITNDKEYSKYPKEIFKKYEVDYLYVNSTSLTTFEKSKIGKIINSNSLSNIIVIFKNGKVVDAIISYESKEKLNKFLQKYDIIPDVLGNPKGIVDSIPKLIDNDLQIIYIPYKHLDEIDNQNNILSKLSLDHSIKYNKIDGYLLSSFQQEKLNSLLEISTVEDQIIIFIKDKKIVGSIRGINNKNAYIEKLYEYKLIASIDNYMKEINYNDFDSLINSNNKNIIIIGKDECKYCNETIALLNKIIINYDINVNYINIGELDSDISKQVENRLSGLGYNDGFTTPITILTESNKVLDYIIGTSNEQYFIDIFKENGIINKEV